MTHPFPIGSKVRVVKTSGFSHTDYNYDRHFNLGDVCEVISYRYTLSYQLYPDNSYKWVEIFTPRKYPLGCHVECFARLVTDDFEITGEE